MARLMPEWLGLMNSIWRALAVGPYLVGSALSIADISFVCDFAQFLREGHYAESLAEGGWSLISGKGPADYPSAFGHMMQLSELPEFSKHLGTYLDWF